MKKLGLFNKFKKDVSGNVMPIFAITAVPLLTLLGGAIDFQRATLFKHNLIKCMDSAGLAATSAGLSVVSSEQQMTQFVNDFASKQSACGEYFAAAAAASNNGTGTGTSQPTGIAGSATLTAKTTPEGRIQVNAYGEIPTSFLQLAGIDKLQFGYEVPLMIEIASASKIEVAMVLDVTGSMNDPLSGSGGNKKISILRTEGQKMIDQLFAVDTLRENTKVGIVPFARRVNVGKQYKNANWLKGNEWIQDPNHPSCQVKGRYCKKKIGGSSERGRRGRKNPNYNKSLCKYHKQQCNNAGYYGMPEDWKGCVNPRNGDLHTNNADADIAGQKIPATQWSCPKEPLTRLSNDPTTLKQAMDRLKASGSTYIPGGLAWGWRVVTNNVPFTEAKPNNDEEWKKAIILMTDGENTVSGPGGVDADTAMQEMCANIKATAQGDNDIRIFTIAFGLKNKPDTNPTKAALKNCATTYADYFDADDPNSLRSAFSTIALEIANLRVSK